MNEEEKRMKVIKHNAKRQGYFIKMIISLIMILLAVEVESLIFSVTSLVIELVACIIYVIFGAKASKVGAINPKFAQNMAKPSVIIGYFLMAIIYAIMYIKNFMKD